MARARAPMTAGWLAPSPASDPDQTTKLLHQLQNMVKYPTTEQQNPRGRQLGQVASSSVCPVNQRGTEGNKGEKGRSIIVNKVTVP